MWSNSTRPVIKVCGVTNAHDAAACATLGVDLVGLLLAKPNVVPSAGSPRIPPVEAASLVRCIPHELRSVLLVHTTEVDEIVRLCTLIRPSALQIQVSLNRDASRRLAERVPEIGIIKSFRVSRETSADELAEEIASCHDEASISAALLDSARGGSGEIHDWSVSAQVVENLPAVPILLAGGLTPTNVANAIRIVRPFGVDVMSGVSAWARGTKDHAKVRAFVAAARNQGMP